MDLYDFEEWFESVVMQVFCTIKITSQTDIFACPTTIPQDFSRSCNLNPKEFRALFFSRCYMTAFEKILPRQISFIGERCSRVCDSHSQEHFYVLNTYSSSLQ